MDDVASERRRAQIVEANETVTLRDLGAAADEGLLQQFYYDVLVPYFSPSELVPLSSLQDGLGASPRDTDVVVAVDGEGAVIGGAVGDWDSDSRVYLLSYLAVRSHLRSKGIGALLMDRVRSWWEERDAVAALAEVDDPRHHPVSDYGDPFARLRFYERLGAQVLGVPYTQPEVSEGNGRVPGMLLISFLVKPEGREGDAMHVDLLRRFLANYLVLSEGISPDSVDREVDALIPEISGRGSVPILPISAYVEGG